jgi:hypothetical protein
MNARHRSNSGPRDPNYCLPIRYRSFKPGANPIPMALGILRPMELKGYGFRHLKSVKLKLD